MNSVPYNQLRSLQYCVKKVIQLLELLQMVTLLLIICLDQFSVISFHLSLEYEVKVLL